MTEKLPEELDLRRLRQLVRKTPKTKAGQVRQAWPEIQALLASGHTCKQVWDWLREIGIEIRYSRFCEYVRELRQDNPPTVQSTLDPTTQSNARPVAGAKSGVNTDEKPADFDPLANLKRSEANRPGFDYRPFRPEDEEKLTGIKRENG